jgi:hypothetical protein
MPYSIRSEPSAEITTLEQVMASVRSRLDGLADEDPAARLLREHLAELTAKRDALTRAQEDGSHAGKKVVIWVLLFFDLVFIADLIIALTDLAAGRNDVVAAGVALLVLAAVFLAMLVPLTFSVWHDVQEYRRIHAGEQRRDDAPPSVLNNGS